MKDAELLRIIEELKNANLKLNNDNFELNNINLELKKILEEKDSDIYRLAERLRLAEALLHARRSEKRISKNLHEDQCPLFDEAEATLPPPGEISEEEITEETSGDETETPVVTEHVRAKKGRRPLSADLPREEIVCDIPEEDKICPCGCRLKRIGEEVSEKLTIVPQTVHVVRTIRPKYACPHCEGTEDDSKTVKFAPISPQIIPQGIVTPSLLAYIVLGKFADALPLYRQSKIFERIGVDISRSTMSRWMIQAANACKPLIALLYENVRAGSIVNMDETPVQVLREPGRANTSKSYMWLTCAGRDSPIRLFHYAPSRSGDVVKTLLGDFKGFLQTDGYAGYIAIGKEDHIKHVGCLVHVRRKFIDVNKGNSKNKPGLATAILNSITNVYKWEKKIRQGTLTDDEIFVIRDEKVKPLLDDMLKRMTDARDSIPPKTLLGTAVKYALGQWERIGNYLLHAQLTPDNNIAENAIRPFVVGRKNWLFSGSPRGAASSAILYSLIETAKANNINPQTYLLHVFENIPLADSPEKLEALLPWNCKDLL